MDFIDLYRIAEHTITQRELAGKNAVLVPVFELKKALIEGVTWLDDINFHPIDTKTGDPLGHYECFSDTDSMWDDPNSWVVLITYASNLNQCGRRFVWCKELMHIFDTESGSVKTADEYRGLLREIELQPIEPSESYLSENQAKWLALLILCPKSYRDKLRQRVSEDGLTYYEIALSLRIPEAVVSSLFSDYYDIYHARFVGV